MNQRPRHLLAIIGLLLLPIILLWPCLFGDRSFVPWDIAQFAPARTMMTDAEYAEVIRSNNTDVTEIPVMFVPELRFILSELAQGRFPQWNPYARSGTTVWASSILGIWYPINWIMLTVDDPVDALALGAFFSIAIAMLLMYGFLIHLGLSIPAALFGALAFGLSGTLTVNLHFYQRINALIWLPGILWAINVIRSRVGRARVPAMLGLALCMFMCHTAGFPPFALVVTLVAVAFCARALVLDLHKGFRPTMNLAFALGGAAMLGVLMSSVQSIPMAEFFPESNRTMQAEGNALAAGGFDPAGLLGYLCPTIFTHPHINHVGGLQDAWSPLFWFLYSRESWLPGEGIPAGTVFQPNLNFCEYTVFVGTPTLLLAIAGLLSRGTKLRWFASGALLTLFVAASATAFIGPLLEAAPFRWVPPSRFTGVTCMFVALLAAWGVQALPDLNEGLRRGIWIGGAVLGATLLGLSIWIGMHYTPETFLQALTPGLQEKYAARFPHVPHDELPAMIQNYMGADTKMALAKLIANFRTAGVALMLSAGVFFALPFLRRYPRGMSAAQTAIVLMAAVELLRFGIPLNTGRELYNRPLNNTPVHEFLREQRDSYRDAGGFSVLRAHADPKGLAPAILPSQLPPDTLLEERIRDQQAYTFVDKRSHLPILAIYGPEQLARNTWALSIRDDEKLNHPFWDLLGVRYILSEDVLHHAGKQVAKLDGPPPGPEVKKQRFFYVYERPHPLPRAWVVHDFRDAPKDPNRSIPANMERTPEVRESLDLAAALADPAFDPARYAILDDATIAALGPSAHRSASKSSRRTVRFPEPDETNTLTLEVSSGESGYLIVNDTKMQGWTVTVDGYPGVIHRANLFQRMVVLPTGQKASVVFSYTAPGFVSGLLLSILGLIVWLGLLGFVIVSRRRRETVEVPS